MKLITVIASTGLAAGLAIGGVAVASATSSPSPSSSSSSAVVLPPGGVLANRITTFCAHAPARAERAAKAQQRLSGSATTKGSIAHLKARQAKIDDKHPKAAQRLGKVVDRRTDRLTKLPERRKNLAAAQTECSTLSLPKAGAS